MSWLAPWALLGLGAIALPILIHLLGRGRAKTQLFPTLRFIERSRLLPTRRTRLHDLILLLVRVAIVASAALALAQPYWRTAKRRQAFEQTLARAIVLDTSASVRRNFLADSARAVAERLASDANASVLLSSADVVSAIPGAVAWLSQKPERRELVIVSDFQRGVVDAQTLARVPADVGIRLLRVGSGSPVSASVQPVETQARFGTNAVTARVSMAPRTVESGATGNSPIAANIEWSVRADTSRLSSNSVRVLASASRQSGADAALAAASSISAEPVSADSSRAIVIVTPGYDQRASMLAAATVPKRQWMLDALIAITRDATLRDAASSESTMASLEQVKGLVVARSSDGRAVITALEGIVEGRTALLLEADVDAASLTTAALISAARNALAAHSMLGELVATQIPDSVLRAWERAPSVELRATHGAASSTVANANDATNDSSDGRWLWVLALGLLALETWLRRRDRSVTGEAATQ